MHIYRSMISEETDSEKAEIKGATTGVDSSERSDKKSVSDTSYSLKEKIVVNPKDIEISLTKAGIIKHKKKKKQLSKLHDEFKNMQIHTVSFQTYILKIQSLLLKL